MKGEKDKIYAEIFSMFQERYDGKEISKDMSLFDDLKMDSIDIISLIVDIEKKYGIVFAEYDQLFESVENIHAFIQYFVDIIISRED